MPFYENVFIARQDVSAARVEALVQTFANVVAEHGGKLAKHEYWGLRTLTYRIKKNRKGHYVLLNIDAPTAAVRELERNMQLNEDVLRYLTIRVDELEEGPSAMMRGRGAAGRPHREGREEREAGEEPVAEESEARPKKRRRGAAPPEEEMEREGREA